MRRNLKNNYNKYKVADKSKRIADGIVFSSKKEKERYKHLKLLEGLGEIKNLVLQPKFLLQEEFIDSSNNRHREINYIADFQYNEFKKDGTIITVVEDVKGVQTKEYIIKKKLFLKKYPNIIFREVFNVWQRY